MKKTILVLLVMTTFLSCKNDENANQITLGDFTFSSKVITQNEPFTITYNGEGKLEDSFYQAMQHTQAFPDDLEFVDDFLDIIPKP